MDQNLSEALEKFPSVKCIEIKNKLDKLKQFNKMRLNDDDDNNDNDDFRYFPSPLRNLPPADYFPDSPAISENLMMIMMIIQHQNRLQKK